MQLLKSSRHSKIAGDFGEALVLYLLSKNGFECARVDHTGIDIIARNPHNKEVMGISVKSRTNRLGSDSRPVKIPLDEFIKIKAACRAFNCKPYFAIVVDAADRIRIYITTIEHLRSLYPARATFTRWMTSPTYIARYASDAKIMTIELATKAGRWWD